MTITRSISSFSGMTSPQTNSNQQIVSDVVNNNTKRNSIQSKNGVSETSTKFGDVTDSSQPCSIL
ncbi:hypothetical protein DDB_G0293112 [Dictyostelium discoideum AX4]|uniref:Uncharacterized protein n=1 Tax=Dictyostelium discoideum TaxID=44689 RepID=Q54C84_DICDI|nr:hypothetical protein DDB_G0293112 [Dictyostelium discoideum AX4]EAL60908.1 hypothetical protein DDB_G0293112 [Dictyostelium discoideum AX4]|eukprot:XP_629335.1 hypothetical protein DDB_G0293112 [Dictyostelium discoideum AX4]